MEDKLIKQSADLFKDEENWTSFTELQKLIPKIKIHWITNFVQQELKKIETPKSWKAAVKHNGGVWFLSDETKGQWSLGIWIENDQFSMWADSSSFHIDKIKRLLAEETYSPLKNLFPKSSINTGRDSYIIKDSTVFEDESTSPLSSDQFAWTAGHKPELIREQLQKKLNEFFNPEIEALIRQLNYESRKQ
jgi:hypothetical protein